MEKRKIGTLEVSAMGLGCMGFSHGHGPAPEHDEAIKLIRAAHDKGCTFFDTAEGYADGANEELVGEAVKPFRTEIVLATKLHIPENPDDLGKAVRQHLDASLERLQTDYVDVYYQHRMNKTVPAEDVAAVMGELIAEGKIRGWGQSQSSENEVRRAHAVTPLTAVQSEYSMMERMFEHDVIPACKELGIGFVPFSPLSEGFLSGKYTERDVFVGDDVRRAITRYKKENIRANQPLLDLLHRFASEYEATPAQIALAWMLCKEEFIVPIPGMRSLARFDENFGACDVKLSADDLARIEDELSRVEIHGNRTDEDIVGFDYR